MNSERKMYILLFIALFVWINGVSLGLLLWYKAQSPPDTYYPFAQGFLFDYYQYVSWVKSGLLNNLLLLNRYTEEAHTPTLFNPFFLLTGFLLRPWVSSAFHAYLVLKVVAASLFTAAVTLLLVHTVRTTIGRFVGMMLLITSGTFYWVEKQSGGFLLKEPIDWSRNFNVIEKLQIAPHHHLALAGTIAILLIYYKRRSLPTFMLAVLTGTAAGFANPYISWLMVGVFGMTAVVLFILRRFEAKKDIQTCVALILILVPAIVYHSYLSLRVYPWTEMYRMTRAFAPTTSWSQYLLALGPTLPLSLTIIASPAIVSGFVPAFLISWAYLPLVLYPSATEYLPLNASRIFQSYQYIPLAFITALSFELWYRRIKKFPLLQKAVIVLFVGVFGIYGIIPITLSIQRAQDELKPNYYNVYIPRSAMRALEYLDTKTPPESIVLSGEYVSSMIPAFTHNRVILGRGDASRTYLDKRKRAFDFVDGKLDQNEARQFLSDYRILYILWGVDTRSFKQLPSDVKSLLQEVFHDESVYITRVLR